MIDQAPEYRKQLLNALKGEKFDSIFEPGCGWAENLIAIRELYDVDCCGVDIDESRINSAKETIANNGISKIKLFKAELLINTIPDKSYDISFTYATLLMINDDKYVKDAIKNMIRIARKKIILIEFDGEENFGESERYTRNYTKILNELGIKKIEKTPIDPSIWSSGKHIGTVIKANINE